MKWPPDIQPVEYSMLALAGVVLTVLVFRGVFSKKAFNEVPLRKGDLDLSDFFAGIGLFIIAMSLFVGLMKTAPIEGALTPDQEVLRSLLGTLVFAPVVGYTLFRAKQGFDGGLTEFGLGFEDAAWVAKKTALAFLAILPLVYAAGVVVFVALFQYGYQPPTIGHPLLKLLGGDAPALRIGGVLLAAVIVAPICEEVVFRGLFQTSLVNARGRRKRRWLSIVVTSVLFACIHIAPVDGVIVWHGLAVIFVLSLGLGWVYEHTGSLWAPIGVHMLFNLMNVTMVLVTGVAEKT